MFKYLLVTVVVTALSACGGAEPETVPVDKPQLLVLEDSRWFLLSTRPAGSEEPVQAPVTAPFSLHLMTDRSLSGLADCNVYSGEYSYLNDAIHIGPVAVDAQVCPGEDAVLIDNIFTALGDVAWFGLTQRQLTLRTYEDAELVFERLFEGCAAPQIITGDVQSAAIVITGHTDAQTTAIVEQYQAAHQDFVVRDPSQQTVAVMSENTLQRLRCDPRVLSLSYAD